MIIINPFVGVIWVLRVKRFGFFAIRLVLAVYLFVAKDDVVLVPFHQAFISVNLIGAWYQLDQSILIQCILFIEFLS